MSKEKLTVESVVRNIQSEVFWNVELHSPHKKAKDILINLIKQLRDDLTDKWNKDRQKTFEEIRDEVFDKYIK